MPELPEVETIVNGLKPYISDQKIRKVQISDHRISDQNLVELAGKKIRNIFRRGKYILIDTGSDKMLTIHLRMTGRLLFMENDTESSYIRIRFYLDRGLMALEDKRRFATVEMNSFDNVDQKLGPEPLGKDFSFDYLKKALTESGMSLKAFLLDQKKIAGIGNIYASEIPFSAGIFPLRKCSSLGLSEVKKLYTAVKEILMLSCSLRGTTFSDYLDSTGKKGEFQNHLKVFRREGKPCFCCQNLIERCKDQRSTFYCRNCQK